MADNKYGRVFTEGDVEKILEWVEENTNSASAIDFTGIIDSMDNEGVRFKFEPDEPLFILRGHDKRAIGAIRFYQDHQSPRAPVNHMDAIEKAALAFDSYRQEHPGELKEPD
jgi:hypothetical protein